jgi:hypothetical protein
MCGDEHAYFSKFIVILTFLLIILCVLYCSMQLLLNVSDSASSWKTFCHHVASVRLRELSCMGVVYYAFTQPQN